MSKKNGYKPGELIAMLEEFHEEFAGRTSYSIAVRDQEYSLTVKEASSEGFVEYVKGLFPGLEFQRCSAGFLQWSFGHALGWTVIINHPDTKCPACSGKGYLPLVVEQEPTKALTG